MSTELTGPAGSRLRRLAKRSNRRIRITSGDLARSISWHLLGGRKFYSRYCAELLAAHKWCFIIGCNNSGTSLLQSTMLRTGKVSTLPAEGQIYTRVFNRAERRGYERVWSEYANDLALAPSAPTESVPRLLHDWLRSLELPIASVILEKTPANVVRAEWLQQAFPNSYFVGLVRNGYAVCEGIRRKGRKSLDRAARHWNLVNRSLVECSSRLRNYIEVRYEDLVDDPRRTTAELLSFLGITAAAGQQPLSGETRVRDDHVEIRDFNIESISRLTDSDRAMIIQNASEMLDHFGYQDRLIGA